MSEQDVATGGGRTGTSGRVATAIAVVVAAALVGGAAVVGLRAVGDGIAARGAAEGVTVTGSARAEVRSDRAVWRLSANEQAPDLASAIARTNTAVETVITYLVDNGVPREAIALGGLSTTVNYEYQDGNWTGVILGHSAYRDVTVRSDDVDLVDRLSSGIGAVLESGVTVSSWSPEYYVTTLPELRPRLLEEAVGDALARAEAMVEVLGGEVVGVRSVRSGPFQVSTPDSVDVADYGMYDTSTIDKTVTATVTVTFGTATKG